VFVILLSVVSCIHNGFTHLQPWKQQTRRRFARRNKIANKQTFCPTQQNKRQQELSVRLYFTSRRTWWPETRQFIQQASHETQELPQSQATRSTMNATPYAQRFSLTHFTSTESLFYLTNIVCHFPAPHRRCGRSAELAALIQQAIRQDVTNDICQIK
jgi:hypothetical protein